MPLVVSGDRLSHLARGGHGLAEAVGVDVEMGVAAAGADPGREAKLDAPERPGVDGLAVVDVPTVDEAQPDALRA